MQEKTDAQLLRDYAEHRKEAAFRELVNRHTDVVYASALRQVSSPDLARDIAQSVFTDLARKAQPLSGTLTGDASLLGWLFRSTRFLALNQLRDDRRRQARERHAMENFDPASETAPEWERVQPVLDEAIADLSDEDRDALLLRFFKNRDFRAIGAALGVSDDAAQKRVSRALERLRTQLTSRGVTSTAAALSIVLSANAIPLAPAGLAAVLSTAALAGTTLATTATATKAIVMTTLQKTLVTAAIVAAVGTGIYQARQASRLRGENQALEQQQTQFAAELQHLQRQRDEATNRLAGLVEENAGFRLNPKQTEVLKLRSQVGLLRQELSSAAKTNSLAHTLANLLSDPAQKELARVQIEQALKVRYAAFIASQRLSPAAANKLVELITQNEVDKKERLATLVRGEVDVPTALQDRENAKQQLDTQLQALLGEAGASQLGKNELGLGAFLLMTGINTQLGNLALNEEQSRQFLGLVAGAPEAIVREDELDMFRTKEELDAIYQTRFDQSQQMMQQTAVFLTAEQTAAMGVLNSNYWSGIRTQWTLGQQFVHNTFRR